ncbi:MAG: SGNH/GDSL hydrolase family protein, partial [Roseovarius sp.]
ALLAGLDRGVHFLPLADLVPHGDRSYHGIDLIHPSLKGSRVIGQRIAEIIVAHDVGTVTRHRSLTE